jgi:hypothetical protein
MGFRSRQGGEVKRLQLVLNLEIRSWCACQDFKRLAHFRFCQVFNRTFATGENISTELYRPLAISRSNFNTSRKPRWVPLAVSDPALAYVQPRSTPNRTFFR